MKIGIVPAATVLSGLIVVLVASVTLSVSYVVFFGEIRNVGRTTAESMSQNSVLVIDSFFRKQLDDADVVQKMIRMDADFPLPRDDAPVIFRHKWRRVLNSLFAAGNFTYHSMAFVLADNTMIRGYTLNDANLMVTQDPRAWDGVNADTIFEFADQQSNINFTKTSHPFPKVAKIGNFWAASPVIPAVQRMTNNFSMDSPSYFFTTQHVVVTPAGTSDVIVAVQAVLHNNTGHLLGVASVNRKIDQVDSFLSASVATKNTQVFVVRHTGSIIATTHHKKSPESTLLPEDYDFSQPAPDGCTYPDHALLDPKYWFMLCQVDAVDHPYKPLQHFSRTRGFEGADLKASFHEFRDDSGDVYYVVEQLLMYPKANFTVLLFMPESDILAQVVAVRNLSLILSIVLSIAGCLVTGVVMHLMFRPLSVMCTRLSDTSRLRLEPVAAGALASSPVKEVFDLQTAYRDMCQQLLLLKRFVPHSMFVQYAQGSSGGSAFDDTITLPASTQVDDAITPHESVSQVDAQGLAHHRLEAAQMEEMEEPPENLPYLNPPYEESICQQMLCAEPNQFRQRECSVLCLSFAFGSGASVERTVASTAKDTLWRAIMAVKLHSGVVDQLRPDVFIATFNAHSSCASRGERSHYNLALKAALAIAGTLQEVNLSDVSFGVAVDAGDHLVGACGAADQQATTVVGEAFQSVSKLAELARDRYGCAGGRVIVTETVVAATKRVNHSIGLMPLDLLQMNTSAKVVFEATPVKQKVDIRSPFSNMRHGNAAQSINQLSAILDDPNLHDDELRFRIHFLLLTAKRLQKSGTSLAPRPLCNDNWVFSDDECNLLDSFRAGNVVVLNSPTVQHNDSQARLEEGGKLTPSADDNTVFSTSNGDTVGGSSKDGTSISSIPEVPTAQAKPNPLKGRRLSQE